MTEPKVTALRLIAAALDDDEAKGDYARYILREIYTSRSARAVLVELADVAAGVCRSRYGHVARERVLSEIASLLNQQPEEQRTPRVYKDSPIRKDK
jgi:hypothetical protein